MYIMSHENKCAYKHFFILAKKEKEEERQMVQYIPIMESVLMKQSHMHKHGRSQEQ